MHFDDVGVVSLKVVRCQAPICYLEIPAPQIDKAVNFYHKVFGWNIRPSGLSDKTYWEFSTGEGQLTGGLDPTLQVHDGGVLLYLKVADISETLVAIENAEGSIVRGQFEIGGGYGYSAIFKDPNGNRLGLFAAT